MSPVERLVVDTSQKPIAPTNSVDGGNNVAWFGGGNIAPVLSWATANCLTEGVRPRTGAISADYEFRVIYTDADGQCPSYIRVTVNSSPYDLTSNDGASCQTGRTYYRTITIASAGDLNYSFSASDGIDLATGTPTGNHTVSVIDTSYKVKPGGTTPWYGTIQAAVNATSSAAMILVYPNSDFTPYTYASFSVASKSNRTIKAVCGEDLTIISGGASTVVFQDSTGCTLEGFSVTGATSWYGVSLLRADNATIKTVRFIAIPPESMLMTGPANIDNCKVYDNTNYGIASTTAGSSAILQQ
jgi:hypothetical protein